MSNENNNGEKPRKPNLGGKDREYLKGLGFGRIIDLIDSGICPFCNEKIDFKALDTEEARKEYDTSGMCRDCYETIGKVLHKYQDENEEEFHDVAEYMLRARQQQASAKTRKGNF